MGEFWGLQFRQNLDEGLIWDTFRIVEKRGVMRHRDFTLEHVFVLSQTLNYGRPFFLQFGLGQALCRDYGCVGCQKGELIVENELSTLFIEWKVELSR